MAELEQKIIKSMDETLRSVTEVIHHMYKNEYKYVGDQWFYFSDGHWINDANAKRLYNKVSNEVVAEYLNVITNHYNQKNKDLYLCKGLANMIHYLLDEETVKIMLDTNKDLFQSKQSD